MTTARLSPAASLLRSSRLFSISPPLKSPAPTPSDTATLPYPIHAAIETPTKSWVRGDWGLKRNLPHKSTTKKGTLTIRVRGGIDSRDHITDFEPASDHVITLQKLKELNLPVRLVRKNPEDPDQSAFDPQLDHIDPDHPGSTRRWKFEGPWLAAQNGWQFDVLLTKVAARKQEFRAYVKAHLISEKRSSSRERAMAAGQDSPNQKDIGVTDQELDEYIHYLHAKPAAIGPLIARFLDLPEGPPAVGSSMPAKEAYSYGATSTAATKYREDGPPKTHPSAGVSYFRSGAYLVNHPLYGPQQTLPPVKARVLRPAIRRKPAEVGVAGVIVGSGSAARLAGQQAVPWTPKAGGEKVPVTPTSIAVSTEGKLIITADRPTYDALQIQGLLPPPKKTRTPVSNMGRSMPRLDQTFRSKTLPVHDNLEQLLREAEKRDYV